MSSLCLEWSDLMTARPSEEPLEVTGPCQTYRLNEQLVSLTFNLNVLVPTGYSKQWQAFENQGISDYPNKSRERKDSEQSTSEKQGGEAGELTVCNWRAEAPAEGTRRGRPNILHSCLVSALSWPAGTQNLNNLNKEL